MQNTAAGQLGDGSFFILGCPRSGTSLLSRMLDSHSEIAVPQETQIFDRFVPILKSYGDLQEARNTQNLVADIVGSVRFQEDLGGRLSVDNVMACLQENSFRGVFDAALTAWAKENGKKKWGEKSPQNANYGELIINNFSALKYVNIVRDGRDVALSLKKTDFGPKAISSIAHYWNRFVDRNNYIMSQMPDSNSITVRYEDLLSSPDEVLGDLCRFLGEEFESEMLEFYKAKVPSTIEKKNAVNLNNGLQSGNSNKWKQHLTRDEIEIFESIAGANLEAHGYELSSENLDGQKSVTAFEQLKNIGSRLSGMVRNRRSQKEHLYLYKCYLRNTFGRTG